MREKGTLENDLFDRLASDGRLGLTRAEIDALVADRPAFVGAASAQVRAITGRVAAVVAADPEAGGYVPASIV
jgi:adenylosuccinate lyase